MSYRDEVEYNNHHKEFTQQLELSRVTVDDICKWFKFHAYSNAYANENEERPMGCWSKSLQYWKKA
jgi:hypothetical protein